MASCAVSMPRFATEIVPVVTIGPPVKPVPVATEVTDPAPVTFSCVNGIAVVPTVIGVDPVMIQRVAALTVPAPTAVYEPATISAS